jgi:hypothetical protein
MWIGVILICTYVILNKYFKGHTTKKFISSGLKREADRIIFATVLLICALFTHKELPQKPGLLLLLSSLGVALWDHTQYFHYYAAFSVAFSVAYLIFTMAEDTIDNCFILITIFIVSLLVLAGIEKQIDNFIAECEHLALFVAALYFIRKSLKKLKFNKNIYVI